MTGYLASGPLLEREEERERLADALAAIRAGRGAALFLRGEPGLGKSRLLALAAMEAAPDITVVSAVGQEKEQGYPFALLHQVVESLVRRPGTGALELTRGLDVLRGWFYGQAAADPAAGGSPGARAALLYCAYWLLASVAEARPLLLCLDDLHWSDPDSLEAIRFLVRRLAGAPIGIAGTLRAWPAGAAETADGLVREGAAHLQELRPLTPPATARMLEAVLGAQPTAQQIEQAVRLTGGNPFLLEQLGRLWQAEPDAVPVGRGPSLRRWPLLTRLSGLPPQSLRLLEAASVLGRNFRLDVAREVAALDVAGGEAAIAPLDALGLVAEDGEGLWSFLHPLIQQALYDRIGEARRHALHAQVLDRLRSIGAPAGERAPHALAVARRGDQMALADIQQAAEDAEALAAYESAALYWGQALTLCPEGDPGNARLHYRLGRAHQRAGAQDAACTAFAAGLKGLAADGALRARIHSAWALSSSFVGDLSAARRHIAEAVREAAGHSPALAAEMCVAQGVLLLSFGGWREATAAVRQARRFARAAGDPDVRARATACLSWVSWASGDPRTYRWACEAAAHLPPGPPDELELTVGLSVPLIHGVVAMIWQRYEEARGPLEQANALARARRCVPALIWSATFLTDLAWRRGRLREAFAHAGAIPSEALGLPWLTSEPRIHRGRVLMDMGDLEGAEACFALSAAEARAAGQVPIQMLSAFAQGTLAARRGRWDDALAAFAGAAEHAATIDHTDADPFRWRAEAVEALLQAGRLNEAAGLLQAMEAATRHLGWRGDEAIALRGRAMLAAALGRPADAERDFAAALPLHRQVGEALEEGRTLLAHGAWLRRQGDLLRARGVLDQASVILAACGAGYWLDLAEAERRAAGGRRRRHPGTGPLARLTPQEYRVAELVSQGHSNRQIACTLLVSPKTLETHLAHIYAKLGLATRGGVKEYFERHATHRTGATEETR